MVKGTVFSMIAKIDRVWGISEKRGEASSAREELFHEVKDFILGGSYTKYKNADEVFKYAFLKSTEVEEKTGVDKGAVDMARNRISHQALKIIGEEVFDVLESGEENSVRVYLKNFKNISANFQAKDILPFELIRYINGKSDMSKSFDISECKRELALLYRLKTAKLTEYADTLNLDKLGYLIRILDGSIGSPKEKSKILTWIMAEDLESFVKDSDKELIKFPPEKR